MTRSRSCRSSAAKLGALILVDLVYGGEETALIAEGRERGARVVEGLEVLVRQGASRSASGRGSSPHWT